MAFLGNIILRYYESIQSIDEVYPKLAKANHYELAKFNGKLLNCHLGELNHLSFNVNILESNV